MSCNIYTLHDDRIELEKNSEDKYYLIDPETILASLSQEKNDVFKPMAATPQPELYSSMSTDVTWSQSDYMRIAQAIHQISWGEPLDGQNLYSFSFEMNCSDAGRGTFSEASFNSYEVIQPEQEEEKRIEYWIEIRPAINLVLTTKVEYQPNVNRKEPIDLLQYQITVDEALQIAEENGGNAARLAVDNDCQISAFSPTVSGNGWEIGYDIYKDNHFRSLFTITIDSKTGEYKVLYNNLSYPGN
jgi:hypothetical protein